MTALHCSRRMAPRPTGTVTFLFTDIEGSTRLLHALGDAYASVRGQHDTIIRDAIAACGGTEVDTAGDSFFAVFPSPRGAIQAAVTAQRALAGHDWPAGSSLRVRMGLHTGEGVLSGTGYVGMDVHRAARIAGAAHGGQVILSSATHGLVEHSLPDGTSLRDLGEHRLKDIPNAEHLFDLVFDGLETEFPPPRTLDARPNNLPAQLTSFVGREEQVAEITTLFGRTRLLTLTGPGGTGKSRLALRVATDTLGDYRDGCFFVDLSPITDPVLVPDAIARALGVTETPGLPIIEGLRSHLRHRELLLVVDNFEQVAAAGPVLEDLLIAAPALRALVTSRVVLALRGEQEYAVPPLRPPDPGQWASPADLDRSEAVRLFTERALAVQPQFRLTAENAEAVAEITARLDGLPLAIELAATRIRVLTPRQMLPRLQQSLTLLTSSARTFPERQRTLRGAIAWSYDLLPDAERSLFARLSVFSGGWSLAAAEGVTEPDTLTLDALDGLSSLLDKSLIRADEPNGHPRFSMLETIREFGQEQLAAAGELEDIRRRHSEFFLRLAVEAEPHLIGVDQAHWLEALDRERGNLRAALRWAVDSDQAQAAQEAAGALWRFWHQRGHLAEGRRWLDEILAMPSGQRPTAARARALTGAGGIAWWQIDHPAARAFYDEALAVERQVGAPARIAEALYNDAFAQGAAGDNQTAGRLLEESLDLFRQENDEHGEARVLVMLVQPDAQAGNWDRVIARLEEAVAIWRRLGDRLQLAFDLIWLAFARGRARRWRGAHLAALEALSLFREADNATGIALAFRDLAFLAGWEGRPGDAIRLAGAAESLREKTGGGPPQGFGGMLEGDPAADAWGQLPEAEAERSWQEGRGLSVDEALALALHWSEP
jgi:predicted ATPase/class 3 adenylate cyclase